jgi:membrane protein required for colicin V production
VNFLDIVALIALGWGAYKGFKNGVLIEVAGLIGLVIGFWAGMRLAFLFADYYRDHFHLPEKWVPAIAFFTAFAVGIGTVYLAAWAATKLLQTAQLNLPNRIAGGVFGVLKWGFLVGAFFMIVGTSQILTPATTEGSRSYAILKSYSHAVQGYTIGLVPAARNVLDDMEHYFVSVDSVHQEQERLDGDSLPHKPSAQR